MSAHRVGADRARRGAGVGAAVLALAALSIPTGMAAQETSARPVPARFDADLVEVVATSESGREVGPVWFTRRPDRAFERTVDPWMDRPVVGALGGSALRYLRLTISYPRGVAVVARPGG